MSHSRDIVVCLATIENDGPTEMGVEMDERDLVRFEFKMSFGGISFIRTVPRLY